MLFISENDLRNNIYIASYTVIFTYKVFLRYLICLCIAQTLRVVSIGLQHAHRQYCLSSYPWRLPYYYYLLYQRSKVASSLAQQLHSLNVEVSNRMAFNSRGESGRDTSLELRELVLAFEDMITAFTTTLYFRYLPPLR